MYIVLRLNYTKIAIDLIKVSINEEEGL